MNIFDGIIIVVWASWAGLGLTLMHTQNKKLEALLEAKIVKRKQS